MPALQPRLALAAFAVLCGVLHCASARAQSAELVELAWNAPAGCPEAAEVQARIRKLAAEAKPGGTSLKAEATITRKASGELHLRLLIRAGTLVGERNLEGRSCEDLAGAAAVNLALLLSSREPLRAEDVGAPPASQPSAAEPAGPEAGTATPPSASQAPRAPEASETPREPAASHESHESDEAEGRAGAATPEEPSEADDGATRAWRGLLDLPLFALELGPMPEPSLGGALGAGVWLDRWRFLAEGNLWLRQKLSVTAPLAAGASVDRLAATLRACVAFPFGRFELAPCAHLSLRHVSAQGEGAHIAARTKEATWVAPGAGAQARYQLAAWLALLASVDAAIEGARPRLAIDGVGRVGQLGPAAVKMALGTEWIL